MARLYLDEDTSTQLVTALQLRGHNITHTRLVGRTAASDYDQLLYATQQERIIVTHNRRDFAMLGDAWRQWSHAWGLPSMRHASILALQQAPRQTLAPTIDELLIVRPDLADGNLVFYWREETGWRLYR